ncbi:MAG: DUF1538 domain-containing protein [Clostridiales bacterium]|nr:DUF1538 domain-containing protein [Clostridiales bacterium]
MNELLKSKIREAFSSVLPITVIVLVLSVVWVPLPTSTLVMFIAGAALLIAGMGIFTLGVDMSMLPMGQDIGEQFTLIKQLALVFAVSFGMGALITIAEPDLQVLAESVTSIPNFMLIGTVAVGVGVFMAVSVARVFFNIPLSYLLIGFYVLLFGLSVFVPKEFLSIAFDSGGVTTGPITVPFILAMGKGLAQARGGSDTQDNSFGTVALCSVGPIIMVMILGILYDPQDAVYELAELHVVDTTRDVARTFVEATPAVLREVAVAVLPIVAAFFIFQLLTKKHTKRQLLKICVGFGYTFVGLVMFLTGVKTGFLHMGGLIGSEIAGSELKWLLIPLGMLIGYFIVLAEPAVHVLNNQVEEVSGGAISAKAVQTSLSVGVAISLGIAMLRVLTGISIYWFLIPGYAISLAMTFFVPKTFTGIAFDSGGVASGPMTSTFLLPFAMGACEAAGGNVLTDAFGIVAMVAMTPLIALQVLGFIYTRNAQLAAKGEEQEVLETGLALEEDIDDIVEYDISDIDFTEVADIEDIDELELRR